MYAMFALIVSLAFALGGLMFLAIKWDAPPRIGRPVPPPRRLY